MALLLTKLRGVFHTVPGLIVLGGLYAAMLLLVLMFYTGEGTFIYEAV